MFLRFRGITTFSTSIDFNISERFLRCIKPKKLALMNSNINLS